MGLLLVVGISALIGGAAMGQWRENYRRRRDFSRRYGKSWVNFQKYQAGLWFRLFGWGIFLLLILAGVVGG